MSTEKYIKLSDLKKIADKYDLKRDIRAEKEIEETAVTWDGKITVGMLFDYFKNEEYFQLLEDDYSWDVYSTIKSDSELLRLIADREIKEMEIDGNSKELQIRI